MAKSWERKQLETSLPPPQKSFAKGWRKLKTNNGARVSGPSEQSVAIELGSVFVRRERGRARQRRGCREKGETERKNVATLGFLRVEGLRSVRGCLGRGWNGRQSRYTSLRLSPTPLFAPPSTATRGCKKFGNWGATKSGNDVP